MKVTAKNKRKNQLMAVFFIILIAAVLMVVLFVPRVNKQHQTIEVEGIKYMFRFAANEQTTTPSPGYIRVNVRNDSGIIISAKKSDTTLNCVETGSTKSFDVTTKLASYPVCSNQSHSGYVAVLKYGDTWHKVILVSEDQKTPITLDQAKRIYESLKIQ